MGIGVVRLGIGKLVDGQMGRCKVEIEEGYEDKEEVDKREKGEVENKKGIFENIS